jgi:RNA polymerase sigma factor (sigma-70 family)
MWRVSSDATTSDADAGRASAGGRSERLGGLLERARTGDRGGLRELVRELNPLLWHVARAQGLTSDDAADVVQTAWLEFLRQLRDIRSPQAVTSWLVTTTRREAWHRRERFRRDLPDGAAALEAEVDPAPLPDERLIAGERDRVLWRHFAALPERCRALLRIVSQVDRPDYARIADAFGMPRGSIGPTRGRCLAKLRELLQADPAW